MKKVTFEAILEKGDSGGVFVAVPFDVEKTFGVKGRMPVIATIDGESYTGSILKYGTPFHILIILKSIREKINKGIGDQVKIDLQKDESIRLVELPDDFVKFLKKNKLHDAFLKMSYTHQKEWVGWINSAKKPETKERRMNQARKKLKG